MTQVQRYLLVVYVSLFVFVGASIQPAHSGLANIDNNLKSTYFELPPLLCCACSIPVMTVCCCSTRSITRPRAWTNAFGSSDIVTWPMAKPTQKKKKVAIMLKMLFLALEVKWKSRIQNVLPFLGHGTMIIFYSVSLFWLHLSHSLHPSSMRVIARHIIHMQTTTFNHASLLRHAFCFSSIIF